MQCFSSYVEWTNRVIVCFTVLGYKFGDFSKIVRLHMNSKRSRGRENYKNTFRVYATERRYQSHAYITGFFLTLFNYKVPQRSTKNSILQILAFQWCIISINQEDS